MLRSARIHTCDSSPTGVFAAISGFLHFEDRGVRSILNKVLDKDGDVSSILRQHLTDLAGIDQIRDGIAHAVAVSLTVEKLAADLKQIPDTMGLSDVKFGEFFRCVKDRLNIDEVYPSDELFADLHRHLSEVIQPLVEKGHDFKVLVHSNFSPVNESQITTHFLLGEIQNCLLLSHFELKNAAAKFRFGEADPTFSLCIEKAKKLIQNALDGLDVYRSSEACQSFQHNDITRIESGIREISTDLSSNQVHEVNLKRAARIVFIAQRYISDIHVETSY